MMCLVSLLVRWIRMRGYGIDRWKGEDMDHLSSTRDHHEKTKVKVRLGPHLHLQRLVSLLWVKHHPSGPTPLS
jgi:hypothetical protein